MLDLNLATWTHRQREYACRGKGQSIAYRCERRSSHCGLDVHIGIAAEHPQSGMKILHELNPRFRCVHELRLNSQTCGGGDVQDASPGWGRGRTGPSPFDKHVRSTRAQGAKEAPFGGNTYGDSKV